MVFVVALASVSVIIGMRLLVRFSVIIIILVCSLWFKVADSLVVLIETIVEVSLAIW